MPRHTFHKQERLCGQKAVEALFAGGSKGFTAWPLRAVFRNADAGALQKDGNVQAGGTGVGQDALKPVSQVLIVAPKRRLHHAVDRNRAKRQMREAYRLQKHILSDVAVHLALMWIADGPVPSNRVHESVARILHRVAESMTASKPVVTQP